MAKVLLLLEKGKGKYFHGKTINDIQLDKDIYYSSNSSEDEEEGEDKTVVKKLCKRKTNTSLLKSKAESSKEQNATQLNFCEEKGQEDKRKNADLCKDTLTYSTEPDTDDDTESHKQTNINKKKIPKNNNSNVNKILGRIRWTQKEKDIVKSYFAKQIKNKITPKKHECNQFIVKHGNELQKKDWVRIKTFVYNTFKGN